MENNKPTGVMTAREWTNSPTGGNGFIQPYEAMELYAKYYHEQQSQSKVQNMHIGGVDWEKLRDAFFKECVKPETENTLAKVWFAPHDMFEWFKSRLAGSSDNEIECIKFAEWLALNYTWDHGNVWLPKNPIDINVYYTEKLYQIFKTKK